MKDSSLGLGGDRHCGARGVSDVDEVDGSEETVFSSTRDGWSASVNSAVVDGESSEDSCSSKSWRDSSSRFWTLDEHRRKSARSSIVF